MHCGYEIRWFLCDSATSRTGRHSTAPVNAAKLLRQIRLGHVDPLLCIYCGERLQVDTVFRASYVSDFIITEEWL